MVDRAGLENRSSVTATVGSNPTLSASSHTSHVLRLIDRRAEWQVSWGFQGKPVDWQGFEKPENRSPEVISLRT